MSRLHELAQGLGVEVQHWVTFHNGGWKHERRVDRPDKDIAHDMLEKLPWDQDLGGMLAGVPRFGLHYEGPADRWWWMDQIRDAQEPYGADGSGTFEEAVCALAERHLEQKP